MSPMDSSYLRLLREAFDTSGFTEIATVAIEQGEKILFSETEKLRHAAKANSIGEPWLWFFVKGKGSGRAKRLVDYSDTVKPKTELQYHLRTKWARNTGMFFRHKERGLLVQLDYDESNVMGYVDGYWKLRLYFQFQPIGELRKTGIGIRQIPFLTTRNANTVSQFHLVGKERESPLRVCYRYDATTHGQPLDPNARAQTVKTATDGVLQFLQHGPFTPTHTKDFPPHYAFPKCENLFWQKFGENNRREITSVSASEDANEDPPWDSPKVLGATPCLATQDA